MIISWKCKCWYICSLGRSASDVVRAFPSCHTTQVSQRMTNRSRLFCSRPFQNMGWMYLFGTPSLNECNGVVAVSWWSDLNYTSGEVRCRRWSGDDDSLAVVDIATDLDSPFSAPCGLAGITRIIISHARSLFLNRWRVFRLWTAVVLVAAVKL